MSEAAIYTWLKQEQIDRGEITGLSTDQALELAAAKRRIRQLETRPSWRFPGRSTRCSSVRIWPQTPLRSPRAPIGSGSRLTSLKSRHRAEIAQWATLMMASQELSVVLDRLAYFNEAIGHAQAPFRELHHGSGDVQRAEGHWFAALSEAISLREDLYLAAGDPPKVWSRFRTELPDVTSAGSLSTIGSTTRAGGCGHVCTMPSSRVPTGARDPDASVTPWRSVVGCRAEA